MQIYRIQVLAKKDKQNSCEMQKQQITVSKQAKLFRLGTACAGESANCSIQFLLAIREDPRHVNFICCARNWCRV